MTMLLEFLERHRSRHLFRSSHLKYDPNTGEILEIYQNPTGPLDAVAMQHDVDYSVGGNNKECEHKADHKMVKALDQIPYKQRQWGHWGSRNTTIFVQP